ncbi:MAG: hypothetical protein EP330_14870 [Deltaproteobacteria bacterium]|nr:MAG: hypothetical protein EP330_14870 [Deltaproteobacteria bacterium]
MSEDLYPPGPEGVPADLTMPTAAYKRHAWIAFTALVLFVGMYLALTGWLGWVSYRLIMDAWVGGKGFLGVLLAAPAVFLFVFLAKGLFTVRHHEDPGTIEITAADEPELVAFVHRIADEAGAPRPHRIFLSARVNAAVFYDLSLLNLLFPSRKNLEIGLGLVNALTLDEMKAVIAHEFGHFAQRTMAVGRYMYVAQQVVGDVVANRGILDRGLMHLSYFDIRVAWIGWLMRLMVWAVRALVDTGFRGIMLAQRALSREMELQADLVSVSLAGSDSLVHGLHRLGAADDAWGRALQFAGSQYHRGRAVEDFFALQSHMQTRMGEVLADPTYGDVPPLPSEARAGHRVFKSAMAQPPQMWSTHPPNRQREDNAKSVYLPSTLDARSAWLLFRDPDQRRKQLTQVLFAQADLPAPTETLAPEDAASAVDELFARPWLESAYQGLYYSRSAFAEVGRAEGLFEPVSDAWGALDALYPEQIRADLDAVRERGEELALLRGLQDGVLQAPGGVIRFRGTDMPRTALPELIRLLTEDLREKLDGEWIEVLEGYGFVPPDDSNLASWFENVGGWVDSYMGSLKALANATLASLLETEAHIARHFRDGTDPGPAPSPGAVPPNYRTCTPEQVRERAKRLPWWDRFLLADGWGPGTLRAAAAVAVLAVPFYVTVRTGQATVAIVNGLATSVRVDIGGRERLVPAGGNIELKVPARELAVTTVTESGQPVESLSLDASNTWNTHVYNVAGAAPLVRWTASYGTAGEVPPVYLGAPRVHETSVSYVFEEPPDSISGRGSGGTRAALAALTESSPGEQLSMLEPEAQASLIRAHLAYDPTSDGDYGGWAMRAAQLGMGPEVLAKRLASAPHDVWLKRAEHDMVRGGPAEREVCARRAQEREATPTDADATYLWLRCLHGAEGRRESLAAFAAHPDHPWVGLAAAYAHWEQAEFAEGVQILLRFAGQQPENSTIDLIRVQRLLGQSVTASHPWVAFNEQLEGGAPVPEAYEGYRALMRGQLARAQQLADQNQDLSLLVAIAASDGAPAGALASALALPDDAGVSMSARTLLAALRAREGKPFGALLEALSNPDDAEQSAALHAMFEGASEATVDAAVDGSQPAFRGMLRAAGITMLGERAPQAWRDEVRALLFAMERPYLAR